MRPRGQALSAAFILFMVLAAPGPWPGQATAAGLARQRLSLGRGARPLGIPTVNIAQALNELSKPNVPGEASFSGGERLQRALQGAKPIANCGEVQVPQGASQAGAPRLGPHPAGPGVSAGPAAAGRPRPIPGTSRARARLQAALVPGLALGANAAAWAWGAPGLWKLALAAGLAAAAGRWLYRRFGGSRPAREPVEPPSDEEVSRAALSVIELKGGLVTPLLWIKLAEHKALELERRGAAPEQLERFQRLCREAPIQPGGFRLTPR